jgi:predicted short-subunit dehydrogenase-like oxidoreductase (DUF2520 family)
MIKIAIIGSGNLAQHLISACETAPEIELVQVFARNKNSINHLINPEKIISNFEDLQLVDLYIIAVSDNAIADVSAQIPFKNRLVAHTSGSVSLEDLNENNRKGVFYPLQTFTKSKKIDFSQIPICIESENATDFQLLEKVAQSISQKVFAINSQQRKSLHVAAVFVCNFVNHLYEIGNEICIDNKVPFEILKPLIMETADKINTILPIDAQTGPAKRNDTQTINSHLNFLEDENQKEIYKLLTKSIIDNGKKL